MFFYALQNQVQGPVAAGVLLSLGVTHNTLVWQEGMSDWAAAASVPALQELFDASQPLPAANKDAVASLPLLPSTPASHFEAPTPTLSFPPAITPIPTKSSSTSSIVLRLVGIVVTVLIVMLVVRAIGALIGHGLNSVLSSNTEASPVEAPLPPAAADSEPVVASGDAGEYAAEPVEEEVEEYEVVDEAPAYEIQRHAQPIEEFVEATDPALLPVEDNGFGTAPTEGTK